MITFPNPKLNLGLAILHKRGDGYHDLESLFIPWHGIHDILEIVPAPETSLQLFGIPLPGKPSDNLCVKAWQLLNEVFGIPPVAIFLHKGIPAGAGLGGGSADAAFTLRMLSELFGLGLKDETLCSFAARLGSDCPFFVYNRPMFATGRGERLEAFDIDLSGLRIELFTPGIPISTREAYAGVTPRDCRADGASLTDIRTALRQPIERWKENLLNDFEPSVFAAHPELAEAKAGLYRRGARYASLSGSGSALFGIF